MTERFHDLLRALERLVVVRLGGLLEPFLHDVSRITVGVKGSQTTAVKGTRLSRRST
jgi:hypothetical protein